MGQWKESDSRDMEACGWDEVFWEEIGLGELVEGNRAKIGWMLVRFSPFGTKIDAPFVINFLIHHCSYAIEIGRSVAFPGHPLGSGLTPAAAKVSKLKFLFISYGIV